MTSIGWALNQIAALHAAGFREFEVWPGSKGQPVGMLHPRLRTWVAP